MDKLPVAAICDEFPLRALLVSPDSSLEQILERSLTQTQGRSAIFLVHDNSSLAGILDLTDIRLWGQELKIPAQTSIADAIKKLMSFIQAVIAIVDEQNRVFNDLYIYELMAYAVRQTKGNFHA